MTTHKSKNSKLLWLLALIILAVAYYFYVYSQSKTLPKNDTAPAVQEVKGTSTQLPTESIVSTPSGGVFEVYFTSPFFPGNIEKHLIEKINSAQTSIDLAVYEFNIEEVAQALINAKNRGVKVRVVYDNKQIGDTVQIPELIDANIPAIPDNRSAFMHNKFFVFDDQCVWTGSFNISINAAFKNFENAFYVCSPDAAENYSVEFYEMFTGQFGPSSRSDTPHPQYTVNGILFENYFGPEDEVMEKIIAVVGQAKSTVHFMAFSFTDDDLANKMISLSESGIAVSGIFETRGANSQSSECGKLLQKGFDIRLDGVSTSTFHHKVIIIDGSIVIFGSFNYSANADESNDENLLIIHSRELALLFEQQYLLLNARAIVPSGNTCVE